MFLTLALFLQQAEPPRYAQCMDLATGAAPTKGQEDAVKWRGEGGGFLASQCLGVAYANQQKWSAAAGAFEEAATGAELKKDNRSGTYWAQAGNAWLAAGDAVKARKAIDAALVTNTLTGLDQGEARLDRARALVAAGDMEGARSDIDRALELAAADPLAWLLSATLARRGGDLPRAAKDIAQALRLSPDDASVQLEAGNVAGLSGNAVDARAAFKRAIALAPGSAVSAAAQKGLDQLGNAEE
jgi:tetratricopeptide (TPR) repeat protein